MNYDEEPETDFPPQVALWSWCFIVEAQGKTQLSHSEFQISSVANVLSVIVNKLVYRSQSTEAE